MPGLTDKQLLFEDIFGRRKIEGSFYQLDFSFEYQNKQEILQDPWYHFQKFLCADCVTLTDCMTLIDCVTLVRVPGSWEGD